MACVRRKMKGPKARIAERLDEIREQRDYLVAFLDEKIAEAEEKANGLLKESERSSAFMQNYSKVMKDMDECLSTFVVISATIPEDPDPENESQIDTTITSPFEMDHTKTSEDTKTNDWHNSTSIKEENKFNEHCDETGVKCSSKDEPKDIEEKCIISTDIDKKEQSTGEQIFKPMEQQHQASLQKEEVPDVCHGQTVEMELESEIIESSQQSEEATGNIPPAMSVIIPEVEKCDVKVVFPDVKKKSLLSPILPPQEKEDSQQLSVDEKAEQGLKLLLRQVKKEHKKEKKSKKEKTHKGRCGSITSGHSNNSQLATNENIPENASNISEGCVSVEKYGSGPNICQFDIKEKEKIEVMVTEVMSPTLFWSQISPDSEIQNLMEKLGQHHVKLGQTDAMYQFEGIHKLGTRLSSKFSCDDKWYRALTTKIHGGGGGDADNLYADVFYVDYGNTETVEVNTSLRPLPEEFARLPAQAVPCAMSGIAPPDGCKVWSPEQCLEFANLVVGEMPFYANYKVLPGCPLLFVELFENVDKKESISDILIQKKLASKASNEFIAQLYSQNVSKYNMNGISMHEIVLRQSCKTPFDKVIKIDSSSRIPGKDSSQKPEQLLGKKENTMVVQSVPSCDVTSKNETLETSDYQVKKRGHNDKSSATATDNITPIESPIDKKKCCSDKDIKKIKTKAKPKSHSDKGKTSSAVSSVASSRQKERSNSSVKPVASDSSVFNDTSIECSETKKCESSDVVHEDQQAEISHKDSNVEIDIVQTSNLSMISSNNVCKSLGDSDEWKKTIADDTLDQMLDMELSLAQGDIALEMNTTKESFGSQTLETSMKGEKSTCEEMPELEIGPVMNSKLKEHGLPHTLPEDCDFKGEYDKWMEKKVENTEVIQETENVLESEHENTAVTRYNDFEISFKDNLSISFLMSHIETPNYFYIHLVNENAGAIENLMVDLNEQYGRVNDLVMQRFFDVEPSVKDICCAKFSEDNRFYRAYILEMREKKIKPSKKKTPKSILPCGESDMIEFKVLYIDYGNSEWVERSKIFPLLPKFTEIPPQAVPCTLVTLQPSSKKEEKSNLQWSKTACESFVEMTGYKTNFVGFLIDKEPAKTFRPTMDEPLPIDIVDTTGKEDRWISEDMVRLGLAEFVEFPLHCDFHEQDPVVQMQEGGQDNSSPQDDTSLLEMDEWNPMEQEFHSIRNSYEVDITDPGVAMYGYKAKDRERICRFFNRKGGCWRGQNCPLEHTKYTDGITSDKAPVFCVSDTEQITLPEEGTWLASEVTAIFNPAHFYVTFPFGTRSVKQLIKDERSIGDEGYEGSCNGENIETLMQSMMDHYSKIPFRDFDLTLFALGEIIVTKFSDDGRWYRAKVISTDPDKEKVEVFYVDFGNTEWVSELHVRQMQPQFMHLPFQALECFLPLSPNTEDGKWTAESKMFFKELVDGQVLIAKVLSRELNGVIYVDLYNTENEEVFINQLLIDKGFAKLSDSDGADSTSSDRRSSSSKISSKKSKTCKMLPG